MEKFLRIKFEPYKNFKYYKSEQETYYTSPFDIQVDTYFDGYWSSEKYWQCISEEVLRQFTLKLPMDKDAQDYKTLIEKAETPVSLHVRRGDKTFMSNINAVLGLDGLSYYYEALKIIKEKVKNPTFFIFTDDMPYVKNNLKFEKDDKVVYVDKKIDDEQEFILMSQCKHAIVASSTYSWWAAMLNEQDGKIVITPDKYAKTLTVEPPPERWIKIKRN